MATLVLTAVATVVGGPVVGIAAAALGFGAEQLFGGGKGRQGPRLNDLAVQSSAYGTPLPRLYGTIRASGSVIWANDIREAAHRSGGGKGKPKTTSYSYAASFAVALSGRSIRSIKRIWGDGKLMRSETGEWIIPATMRLYRGEGDELADPLIISAEGLDAAPAYRNMAYAVFEDLDLSEFANHIPSLSFEVEADDGFIGAATIIDDLGMATGFAPTAAAEQGTRLRGFGVASGGSIRSVLETLAVVDPITMVDDGETVGLSLNATPEAIDLDVLDLGAAPVNNRAANDGRMKIERGAADQAPRELSIGYYDVGRDYQTGLQRAHFGGGSRVDRIELPAVLAPGEAKALVERKMIETSARTATATIRLPHRAMALQPGDTLRHPVDGGLWRIRDVTVERMAVELGLDRVARLPASTFSEAEGGRVAVQNGLPNGETLLHVLDLPPLYDEMPTTPRVWIAASGTQQGWRRADISLSLDDGGSWQSVYTASGGSVSGVTISALGEAGSVLWDDRNTVDVELAHDGMWIEGRSDDALLAGANLALIDDELVQFGRAEALGSRRFRLSHLLRGRRGTEWAGAGHIPGNRFVMIDPALVGSLDLPVSCLGSNIKFRAVGPGQDPGDAEQISVLLRGAALLPPGPTDLRAEAQSNGDIAIRWIRRSRQGWSWIDGVDVPLGEEREAYRLKLHPEGGAERIVDLAVPYFNYSVADQTADGGDIAVLNIAVAQLSALAGPGVYATADFILDM